MQQLKVKRLELRMFVDFDENKTNSEILKTQPECNIDDMICVVVKRVDIIDEIEV